MEEGPRGAGQRSPTGTFQCLSGVTPATVKEIGILSSSDKQQQTASMSGSASSII
eukprot:CAMPEP_0198680394 /NCGR_PEP_ID=MMETSP1468-20131203/4737_1 /TAXON_ID=1461545 /ORGANISM="Mantoniella sp, Strain CCMP1436" /LENGTH=54 /DNA_ID=CAMNT_0044420607 /DNA_START=80 /DNA_END=244 /DNA_ORIENTATION=-